MKKILTMLLAMLMTAALCGCSGLADIELPPLPTVTTELAEATASPTEAPSPEPADAAGQNVMVSIKRNMQQAYDPQNGTQLILSFSYDTPTVYIEGGDGAAAAINERIALMDETYYTGNDYGEGQGTGYNNMLTMAEDNYNYVVHSAIEGAMLEMVSSRTVSVERIDSQVLTLLYNDYTFTGGVHGNYGNMGCSFDVSDGRLLSLEDLSGDYEGLAAFLLDYMVKSVENDQALAERIDLGLFDEGAEYTDILAPLLRQGSWYFDGDGLVIFSDLYEISSYAAGPIFFTIPYDELNGHVDDKWLPAEISADGSMEVISGDAMVDGSMTIVDKLVVDAEGEQLYLAAKGRVCNVRISGGDYVDSFYVTENLWSSSHMEDSALQLVCTIPEGMPDLRISYENAEGEQTLYLSRNGTDGSPVLTAQVEPVG